jgi:uncharacterized membrane protein
MLGVMALVGGTLLTIRGATNLGVGRSLGLGGGRRSIDVRKTIELEAPVEQAYDLWNRFETFPEFMSHVREVQRTSEDRSHWVVAGPGGVPIEFDAVVTRRVPNEVIAWKSEDGEAVRHSGIVRFEPAGDDRSRVDVQLTYNPPAGVIGHAVNDLFGTDPKQALDDDMLRLQSLLAHGKTTTGDREASLDEVGGARIH